MDVLDADDELAGVALIPVIRGPIADIKELMRKCREAEIPAAAGCPPGAGRSCGTKLHLLVKEADVPRVMALIHADWLDLVAKEGTVSDALVPVVASEDSELPCPACGMAAPLADGECTGCGLYLGA